MIVGIIDVSCKVYTKTGFELKAFLAEVLTSNFAYCYIFAYQIEIDMCNPVIGILGSILEVNDFPVSCFRFGYKPFLSILKKTNAMNNSPRGV